MKETTTQGIEEISLTNGFNEVRGEIPESSELDSSGHEKSVDEEVWSNFRIDTNNQEKEARQNAIEGDGNTFMDGDKKQKNKDIDNLRDIADLSKELREDQQEELAQSLTGRQFTEADMDAAVIAALQNFDEASKGMSDEKKTQYKSLLDDYYNAGSTAEKEVIKEKMNDVVPNQYEDLEIKSQQFYIVNNPDAEISMTSNEAKQDIIQQSATNVGTPAQAATLGI